ncbi:MAG: hypothetical protein DRQ40_02025 [Gammaproteobacteria bacterium]|nr:MAG: hypothetical protein DRQ40_02025 [Gammaproteobacteria bacterium]
MLKQYFISCIAIVVLLLTLTVPVNAEDVCITERDTVDIISLLDASERDMDRLSTCTSLVDKLYKELEHKDLKLASLTQELIGARQDVIKYKARNKRLQRITWYAVGTAVIVILVDVLPAVL